MTFRRLIQFEKGYNYLHEQGTSRRGQHGMAIRFVFVGPDGATQFLMNTMWTPLGEVDAVQPRDEAVHIDYWRTDRYGTFGTVRPPSGYDLGYHWRAPLYEGAYETAICQYLGGASCFYDGSGMAADGLLRDFITNGEAAVWRTLIQRYRDCLHDASEHAAERVGATS